MTQIVICDGCEDQYDWADDKGAFFPGGGVLLIRDNSGGRDDGHRFDLCALCIETIQKALPDLGERGDKEG